MEQGESGWAAPIDGLIAVQREAEGFAEEWQRTREPLAEGHSARVAIETLRALTFRTVASSAGATDAPLDGGGTHDVWVAPDGTDAEEANVTESVSDASEASDARDAPVRQDGRDARRARDDRYAGVPQDIGAVRDAPDEREYSVARDVEMRRRDRERLLWPTDPPFCPSLWHTFG